MVILNKTFLIYLSLSILVPLFGAQASCPIYEGWNEEPIKLTYGSNSIFTNQELDPKNINQHTSMRIEYRSKEGDEFTVVEGRVVQLGVRKIILVNNQSGSIDVDVSFLEPGKDNSLLVKAYSKQTPITDLLEYAEMMTHQHFSTYNLDNNQVEKFLGLAENSLIRQVNALSKVGMQDAYRDYLNYYYKLTFQPLVSIEYKDQGRIFHLFGKFIKEDGQAVIFSDPKVRHRKLVVFQESFSKNKIQLNVEQIKLRGLKSDDAPF